MTPQNMMIERVARALAASSGSSDWAAYTSNARAAVAAMREPTTDMLEAATPELLDYGHLPEEWRAMIDHVLNERLSGDSIKYAEKA